MLRGVKVRVGGTRACCCSAAARAAVCSSLRPPLTVEHPPAPITRDLPPQGMPSLNGVPLRIVQCTRDTFVLADVDT